ncbi:hypothetical protein FSS13T_22390 [Flavobacterium saliperosum S13]|uniref:Uncharacterized protein n=1 Tax=Flavobacterium saliperosum S13 TaxID=1341155 RepID=A0ABN0QES5_9FLAO|nr:hypothetical protein FSS13T_22390 [Flavobacterium saliperosum S13]
MIVFEVGGICGFGYLELQFQVNLLPVLHRNRYYRLRK